MNGNRNDVMDQIWLLTDGGSSDQFEGPAKALRDAGVEIMALAFRQKGKEKISMKNLVEITGHAKNVIEINDISQPYMEMGKIFANEKCDYFCQRRCLPLTKLPNGKITCSTKKATEGSNCKFKCNSGHKLIHSWRTKAKCLATIDGVEWNQKLPCCGIECCTTNVEKDVVIVVDSSGSIGADEYEITKKIILNTIRSFKGNKVQFSLVHFSDHVHTKDTIYFGNKSALVETINHFLSPTGGKNNYYHAFNGVTYNK
uniref:uncharacterized protein LOC120331143 n=1 Tax=Styela clava TaxID=7725 RepID=UPI00193A69E1|nr:uncharacterized protein LOC120331143 [Styela clava]